MTKAQMVERIAELESEVEALKAGASVETHIHYHYPQLQSPATPASPNYTWPWTSPFYLASGGNTAGANAI